MLSSRVMSRSSGTRRCVRRKNSGSRLAPVEMSNPARSPRRTNVRGSTMFKTSCGFQSDWSVLISARSTRARSRRFLGLTRAAAHHDLIAPRETPIARPHSLTVLGSSGLSTTERTMRAHRRQAKPTCGSADLKFSQGERMSKAVCAIVVVPRPREQVVFRKRAETCPINEGFRLAFLTWHERTKAKSPVSCE
jgi:hypothetical protein